MTKISSTAYFRKIDEYLRSHKGQKPLSHLEQMARQAGCPEDEIDMTVNGALKDFVFDMLPNANHSITILDRKCNEVNNAITVTLEEWIELLCNTIEGLPRERAVALFNYMQQKSIIIIAPSTGIVYGATAMMRMQQIKL